MSLDVVIILAGAIYGYVRPGKEDKVQILKSGLRWGLILGVVLGVIGLVLNRSFVAVGAGISGVVLLLVVAFVISIEFIIGTALGDFLEGVIKK